jgi:hypothetical protein
MLSNQQIEELFAFTQKKFVPWYDLQVELVDHLAEKIEEEMAANPKLVFKDALQKVYAGFGIFGFAKIVQEKEEQVRMLNKKLFKKEFYALFNWPNCLRTLALATIIFTFQQVMPIKYFAVGAFLFCFVQIIVDIVRRQKVKNKKLLLTQRFDFAHGFGFFYILTIPNRMMEADFWLQPSNQYILSTVVFFITLLYLASRQVVKNLGVKARQLYPAAYA